MSEQLDCDVLIAGAGLVGLSLAAALVDSGLSLALTDRNAVTTADSTSTDTWDARIYAISPGSAEYLRSIGAWQRIPCERMQPIESMVVRGDQGASMEFTAHELGERALAWIVEERSLRTALVPLVRMAGVPVLAPCALEQIAWSPEHASLVCADGSNITARLVVGADGLRSRVREAAGVHAQPEAYAQTAVVANFACQRAHHARAWQWFRPDGGVLAWLPLPGRRMSMVWSAPHALAQDLLALAPYELAERVAAAGDALLGELTCIAPPAAFPLSHLQLASTIAHRVALVGDAAHGVHPLAGQGVNLGFGDAAALATVLRERGPVTDAGAPFLLERYARKRAEPITAMHMVTDGLARLFGANMPFIPSMRNAGLAIVGRLAPLKRALARPALR